MCERAMEPRVEIAALALRLKRASLAPAGPLETLRGLTPRFSLVSPGGTKHFNF